MNRIIKLGSVLLILTALLIPAISQAQQSADSLQVLYVSGETVDCVGVAPQTCLQIKSSPDAEWELLYNGILNFQPQTGMEYTLSVRVIDMPADIADAPSFQYQLVEILNRTQLDDDAMSLASHYAPTDEFFILEVAGETIDCVGVAPQTCLQIRMAGEEDWQWHYDDIVDFAYIEGFEYTLVVQKMQLTEENLADVSSFLYRLVRIVNKTAVGDNTSSMMLDGTSWVLSGYETAGVFEAVADNVEITLEFINGEVAGSAGCNNYFGTYTQDDDQLTFGIIGSTLMACQEDVMQQEIRFLGHLETVSMFTLDGTSLRIQTDGETILVFDPIVSTD